MDAPDSTFSATASFCPDGHSPSPPTTSQSRKLDRLRHAGLDVTVHSSDGKRSPGHLSRQGSPLLRWAAYEAGYCAARHTSPDHAYYLEVRDRAGGNRAALAVARKILRRSHHILRELGDRAFAPV